MDDVTTFALSFLAAFGGIAALLWHLERRARALESRLATLEAAQRMAGDAGTGAQAGKASTATPKRGHGNGGPQP